MRFTQIKPQEGGGIRFSYVPADADVYTVLEKGKEQFVEAMAEANIDSFALYSSGKKPIMVFTAKNGDPCGVSDYLLARGCMLLNLTSILQRLARPKTKMALWLQQKLTPQMCH